MTKRVQQLIAACLALGLMGAGCLVFSPTLHVLLEHGGRGPAHLHLVGSVSSRFQSAHRPFRFPSFPIRQPKTKVAHALVIEKNQERPIGKSESPSPVPAPHEHHSLVSTLAAGGLESPLEFSYSTFRLTPFEPPQPSCHTVLPQAPFDLQSAGRAPPHALN